MHEFALFAFTNTREHQAEALLRIYERGKTSYSPSAFSLTPSHSHFSTALHHVKSILYPSHSEKACSARDHSTPG